MSREIKFAPREAFETVLTWGVIPTFDLVLTYGDEGVIVVRRKIAPYRNVWALPGLRMFKPESIEDTLTRIARDELGLAIDARARRFLGQYVARFKTEHERQDLSTAYHIPVEPSQEIRPNPRHFSGYRIVRRMPEPSGAMYRFHFDRYLESAGS